MQDGPPNGHYEKTHRECSKYSFRAYTIDERGAYGSPRQISTLVRDTWQKVSGSVKAYEGGARDHFPYANECCYCN
jgi:hypothetical protein